MRTFVLEYIGAGAFVPPFPARSLTREEVQEYGLEALLETGLYRELDEPIEEKQEEVDDAVT